MGEAEVLEEPAELETEELMQGAEEAADPPVVAAVETVGSRAPRPRDRMEYWEQRRVKVEQEATEVLVLEARSIARARASAFLTWLLPRSNQIGP